MPDFYDETTDASTLYDRRQKFEGISNVEGMIIDLIDDSTRTFLSNCDSPIEETNYYYNIMLCAYRIAAAPLISAFALSAAYGVNGKLVIQVDGIFYYLRELYTTTKGKLDRVTIQARNTTDDFLDIEKTISQFKKPSEERSPISDELRAVMEDLTSKRFRNFELVKDQVTNMLVNLENQSYGYPFIQVNDVNNPDGIFLITFMRCKDGEKITHVHYIIQKPVVPAIVFQNITFLKKISIPVEEDHVKLNLYNDRSYHLNAFNDPEGFPIENLYRSLCAATNTDELRINFEDDTPNFPDLSMA